VQVVLRIVLAVLIALGGSLPNATAHASAPRCAHESMVGATGAASDDCPGGSTERVAHGVDHCIVASGGCCAPLQSTPAFEAPVTTTADVDWLASADRSLLGLTFAPATPPPRA